jgi:DNA-binding response OmpR family regulator/DNA-binding CsgD family transcriptional regulator
VSQQIRIIMQSKILIVDDAPANLAVLFNHLRTLSYHVLVSDNGLNAVEQAARILPDLILLDVRMEGMDGYETCRAIKANAASTAIPVLFLSALTDKDDRLKGFEAGGVDYITKPIDVEEVTARIQTHLRLAYLQQRLTLANEQLEERVIARTAELEAANLALQAEVKERRQRQQENEQLLALLQEQNQQLNHLMSWMLQSRPKTQIELTQLISQQLLDNCDVIGNGLEAAIYKMKAQEDADEVILNLLFSIRLRYKQMVLYLSGVAHAGKVAENGLPDASAPLLDLLTEREREILALLCDGLPSNDIAEKMAISDVTVRSHRTRLMRKLKIDHIPGLVKFALRHNLTGLD